MSREWHPGDVALLTFFDEVAIGVRNSKNSGWRHASAWAGGSLSDNIPHEARPLAVIDPEDREQVERLDSIYQRALDDAPKFHSLADIMQAALREFADPKPTKPDEPTGLGAVVVDIEGIRWTRVESGEAQTRNPWYPADADFQPDEWHNLCAVEVLSEGVTP